MKSAISTPLFIKPEQGQNGIKAKICLVGERRVGKSSLVKRYVLDEFSDEYLATIGMKVYKKIVMIKHPIIGEMVPLTLTIWDIMGDEVYGASMKEIYLHGAAGIMAVADVSDPQTVSPLNNWVNPSLEILGDVPVQIILNKRDAGENETAVNTGRWVAKKSLASCYLTSASRGENIEHAFNELAHRILSQMTLRHRRLSEDKVMGALVTSIGDRRTLEQMSEDIGEPPLVAEPRLRGLVRSGHLALEDVEISTDGRPIMSYRATGKLLIRPEVAKTNEPEDTP